MNELSLARKEMDAYCRYLLGKSADQRSLELFECAIKHEATTLLASELELVNFMLKNPWCIGCIDAALGLFYPNHKLRKRMIVAFAILETNILYFDFFKPKQFGRMRLAALAYYGIKEGLMAVTGSIILKIV